MRLCAILRRYVDDTVNKGARQMVVFEDSQSVITRVSVSKSLIMTFIGNGTLNPNRGPFPCQTCLLILILILVRMPARQHHPPQMHIFTVREGVCVY